MYSGKISCCPSLESWQAQCSESYVITTVEVDAVMFGRNIKPISFVYSGIITFGFSMFVNMVMHFKLKKINMVESLKSVE